MLFCFAPELQVLMNLSGTLFAATIIALDTYLDLVLEGPSNIRRKDPRKVVPGSALPVPCPSAIFVLTLDRCDPSYPAEKDVDTFRNSTVVASFYSESLTYLNVIECGETR